MTERLIQQTADQRRKFGGNVHQMKLDSDGCLMIDDQVIPEIPDRENRRRSLRSHSRRIASGDQRLEDGLGTSQSSNGLRSSK